MIDVVFDPDARAEFLSAVEYYEQCQKGLGKRFKDAVEAECSQISRMPFGFRVVQKHFRRCLVAKFPYAIFFSIEPDYILIVAVGHVRRMPGYWQGRQKDSEQ